MFIFLLFSDSFYFAITQTVQKDSCMVFLYLFGNSTTSGMVQSLSSSFLPHPPSLPPFLLVFFFSSSFPPLPSLFPPFPLFLLQLIFYSSFLPNLLISSISFHSHFLFLIFSFSPSVKHYIPSRKTKKNNRNHFFFQEQNQQGFNQALSRIFRQNFRIIKSHISNVLIWYLMKAESRCETVLKL